jgi:hypothetical protein
MMDEGAAVRHHDPDPELMARCTELRALQVALVLVAFHDDFGDMGGWDEGIRDMLGTLSSAT